MTQSNIGDRVKVEEIIINFIRDEIGIDEEFKPDTFIKRDLNLDSTEIADLILHIKKIFNRDISIEDDLLISDIVSLILL